MKVSVCIPVYGVEKYIERCARSLFEQTMKDDIEFIFVDDCTPDASMEVLQRTLEDYPERKSQVKIVTHEVNKGLIGARNTALKHAIGDYIIHCDSDDWVEKNMYELLYNEAAAQDADIVCCDFSLDYDDARSSVVKLPKKNKNQLQALIDCNLFWSLCSKMVRALIAKCSDIYVPEDLCYSEDLLRLVQMFNHAERTVFVHKPLYHYYQGNKNSYSKDFKRIYLDQQIKIVHFLEKNQIRFDLFSVKGDILFHGIVRGLFNSSEVKNLWKEEHGRIVFYRRLHWVKRCVVASAFISYPFTVWFCRHLFAKRYGLKRR